MCGRFSMGQGTDGIAGKLSVRPLALLPRFNIAPTQNAPIVLCDGAREMRLLRWGLIPFWAKDESIGQRMINARAESLLEKPSFKRPFERQRCLVLADGYYEWQKRGTVKVPFRFTLRDGQPFALAGLWDQWHPSDGQPIATFTIITTAANDLACTVHDRMPVILPPEHYDQWLDPAVTQGARLTPLLQPYSSEAMTCYPVSSLVNNARIDDPRCIEKTSEWLL
jgi:putative SOS response-associated peptidase YedK